MYQQKYIKKLFFKIRLSIVILLFTNDKRVNMIKSNKSIILLLAVLILILSIIPIKVNADEGSFIKWMEFNATASVMKLAYDYDVKSQNSDCRLNFVELLSYVALKNANKFNFNKDRKTMEALVTKLRSGKSINEIVGNNKYYNYYLQCFEAVVGQFVGKYQLYGDDKEYYGLRAFHPISKNFYYNEFDDFGTKRNFGYNRPHLGHDIMGNVGTPIIAIESGIIAELGWNRYGGWRIGIVSLDTKRYYYYAHLRKGQPFASGLTQGDSVTAGQVIGYLGVTGYSYNEDTNMKCPPHLHMGLQIIFDESQRSGNKEIWIDLFELSKFLSMNKAAVIKSISPKEYNSTNMRIAI